MKQKSQKPKRGKRKLNAVIYTRQSYPQVGQCKSLEGQKEVCLTYAEIHNLEVLEVYEEKGHSHDAIKAFLNMLAKEDSPVIAFLLVHKLSKITYNSSFAIYLASELEKHGIRIISVGENYKPTPEEFKLYCFELLRNEMNDTL